MELWLVFLKIEIFSPKKNSVAKQPASFNYQPINFSEPKHHSKLLFQAFHSNETIKKYNPLLWPYLHIYYRKINVVFSTYSPHGSRIPKVSVAQSWNSIKIFIICIMVTSTFGILILRCLG